jgi:cytochrome c biogenesis protein CcdA/HEAT repeat protein/glutaredoxin
MFHFRRNLVFPGLVVFISAFQLFSVSAFAQDEAFERFRNGTLDLATLAEVLPQLADAERRAVIRTAILEAKAPPRSEMVALLDHPVLAVRLGALELLEEMAGGDLGYNPWAPAESPENLGPLARWKAWAGENPDSSAAGSIFSDEQRRGYLRELLAGDNDKAARARRMLEAEGLSAVGFLETFLENTPTLPPGGRARIREAQYQIALARQLGDQAAVTARQLAFGSRDQLLSAIATVRGAGMLAIPILRDFITHPDPLVRETAIDSLLLSAGQQAVDIIAPLLSRETDVNVIHGAFRRLKDIRGEETEKLVASFLTHPDEDLLVSAIQTSLTLSGDNDRYSSGGNKAAKPPESDAAILACLADPRWRVRANALEYITKRKLSAAKDQCIGMLEDDDEFVRFAAIKAIVALGAREAVPKLKAMLLADDAMAGPVIEAFGGIGETLDAEVLAKLDAAPPDARLAAVRAAGSISSLDDLVLRYAADSDLDVACAALRAIATSSEKLKRNRFASVIVEALRSNNEEKHQAVLERLNLPSGSSRRLDPMLLEALHAVEDTRDSTALDPLYDAFLLPGADAGKVALAPETPDIPAAQEEILKELAKRCTAGTPAGIRFNAALTLAAAGGAEGYVTLLRDLPSLTTAQKSSIAGNLDEPSSREAIPLLTALLRDPVPEVREAAAEAALSNEKAKALISLVIDELSAPDARLQPHEVYGYRFDYAARRQASLFRAWCLGVLESETSSAPQRVLATIAARHCPNTRVLAALRKQAASEDAKVRRAAWHALIIARPAELSANAGAIADDPEAFVRAVIPDRVMCENYTWSHQFSDTTVTRDNHSVYDRKKTRVDDALREILTRLAGQDPSSLIRFEASFALVGAGVPIDFDAFVSLLPKLTKETNAVHRISEWLEENAARATPALRPLLAIADPSKIQPEKLKLLNSRVSPEQAKGIVTFASLAEGAAKAPSGDAPLLTEEADATPQRTSLEVVYFHKPGCQECAKTKQLLSALKTDFPLIEIHEHNILDTSGTVLNQALCARLGAPSTRHSIAPAVFTQAGFSIGPDISPASLGKLMADTMATAQDDSWSRIDEPEIAAAAKAVDRRYESITLPVVLIGGLLDGINPCAFATIIFFLSYLQVARRTPREMLMVGAAFISAVFLAYLAAGLLLHEALAALSARFAGIQRWMNYGFGGLALVAAWFSARDALRARAGRMEDMTLQLPGLLKDRIRGVIRSGARARNFVIAAFVSGLVISLLELACTGQVYAPIIYQIQKGRLDAVLWLVIYNLAFVTPLIGIFLLAYGGLRSETLVEFQKKHTFSVKLGLAALFLVLAAVILFGTHLLPH